MARSLDWLIQFLAMRHLRLALFFWRRAKALSDLARLRLARRLGTAVQHTSLSVGNSRPDDPGDSLDRPAAPFRPGDMG